MIARKRIQLPAPVEKIYEAVEDLDALYEGRGRRFTPDGHLVGSIGEVVIADEYGLKLYPSGNKHHDACGPMGDVQIKIMGPTGKRIALNGDCNFLIVGKIINPQWLEILYCGPGAPVCALAGRRQGNGQSIVRLSKILALAS